MHNMSLFLALDSCVLFKCFNDLFAGHKITVRTLVFITFQQKVSSMKHALFVYKNGNNQTPETASTNTSHPETKKDCRTTTSIKDER